ncbi:MAG: Ig-like domain-containing protein [Granulosicoccus sp.]
MQSIIRPVRSWLVAPALVLLIAGCSSDSSHDFEASNEAAVAANVAASSPEAIFNPSTGAVPFPNNLLFVNSEDGTLNIPIAESADQTLANPQVALNQQDGFSTISPIITAVSEPLDQGSLILGENIHVFEVTTLEPPVASPTPQQRAGAKSVVTGIVTDSIDELASASRLNVSEINNQLVISPLQPLKPSTSYMVVLTNGITDVDGNALQKSFLYNALQGDTAFGNEALEGVDSPAAVAAVENLAALEALRTVVGSHSAVLSNQIEPDKDVVLTWVFSTQSTREVLQAVKDISNPTALFVTPAANPVNGEVAASPLGLADLYVGSLDLPYYQSAVGDDNNPLPALGGFWKNAADNVPGATDVNGIPDYTPEQTALVRVPVLMSVPNTNSPSGGQMPDTGWPITVFMHGITGNRTNMLGIADSMARAGRVVIAIDLPMHGLTEPTEATAGLLAANALLGTTERSFGIDVSAVDPDTGVITPGPDGVADPSGTHFYNIANLANTRDNLRQSVADLFVLTANVLAPRAEGIQFDPNNLSFVGHSLGAIVGTTMLAFDNSYQAATLGMPGGGIAQLLANSTRFGPVINGSLAANGVETGSSEYLQFLTVAQTLIDSGDPVNHAGTVAAQSNTRIHLIEVIDDAVIPNRVALAPLSGTEPLISLLNLPSVDTTVMDSNAAVRFTSGDHSSLLRPMPGEVENEPPSAEAIAITTEMQSQTAGFANNLGATLPVDNTAGFIQDAE